MSLITPDFGLFFWMLLAFGVVFFLLRKFAWGPIMQGLQSLPQDTLRHRNRQPPHLFTQRLARLYSLLFHGLARLLTIAFRLRLRLISRLTHHLLP